jgi:hypothetical protein
LDRHLAKYASFLEGHGYSSVRAICPLATVFSPFTGSRRQWAAHLLEFLLATDPDFKQ